MGMMTVGVEKEGVKSQANHSSIRDPEKGRMQILNDRKHNYLESIKLQVLLVVFLWS